MFVKRSEFEDLVQKVKDLVQKVKDLEDIRIPVPIPRKSYDVIYSRTYEESYKVFPIPSLLHLIIEHLGLEYTEPVHVEGKIIGKCPNKKGK